MEHGMAHGTLLAETTGAWCGRLIHDASVMVQVESNNRHAPPPPYYYYYYYYYYY